MDNEICVRCTFGGQPLSLVISRKRKWKSNYSQSLRVQSAVFREWKRSQPMHVSSSMNARTAGSFCVQRRGIVACFVPTGVSAVQVDSRTTASVANTPAWVHFSATASLGACPQRVTPFCISICDPLVNKSVNSVTGNPLRVSWNRADLRRECMIRSFLTTGPMWLRAGAVPERRRRRRATRMAWPIVSRTEYC